MVADHRLHHGCELAKTIAQRQVLRYAGYCYDSESGMYYLSARHYDPATRQFLSKDLSRNDGEQSAYQYCWGNPVGNVDPTGLSTGAVFGAANALWSYLLKPLAKSHLFEVAAVSKGLSSKEKSLVNETLRRRAGIAKPEPPSVSTLPGTTTTVYLQGYIAKPPLTERENQAVGCNLMSNVPIIGVAPAIASVVMSYKWQPPNHYLYYRENGATPSVAAALAYADIQESPLGQGKAWSWVNLGSSVVGCLPGGTAWKFSTSAAGGIASSQRNGRAGGAA